MASARVPVLSVRFIMPRSPCVIDAAGRHPRRTKPSGHSAIGPKDILGARRRSFWLDGDLGRGYSWQRFIARLVAHGPVTEYVPESLLQEVGADYTMLGTVADDLVIEMS